MVSEMLRRLIKRMVSQGKATDALTNNIWWLNLWLVGLTVILVILTAAQVYVAAKGIR